MANVLSNNRYNITPLILEDPLFKCSSLKDEEKDRIKNHAISVVVFDDKKEAHTRACFIRDHFKERGKKQLRSCVESAGKDYYFLFLYESDLKELYPDASKKKLNNCLGNSDDFKKLYDPSFLFGKNSLSAIEKLVKAILEEPSKNLTKPESKLTEKQNKPNTNVHPFFSSSKHLSDATESDLPLKKRKTMENSAQKPSPSNSNFNNRFTISGSFNSSNQNTVNNTSEVTLDNTRPRRITRSSLK